MKSPRVVSFGVGLLVASAIQQAGFGQVNQVLRTPAAQYFAGRNVTSQLSANPTAPSATGNYVPAPQQVQVSGSKPFQNIQHQPTLTPYLGLDALPESSTSLPNWHMFVQPQIQQRASNESQSRELQRLRQQVRVATARGIVSKNSTGGMPTTGSSSQFMNMGSYYPGVR